MLDLKTLLVLEFCITALLAIAWILIWMAWRHLYQLKFLAAGFTAIALGLLLLLERGPDPALWRIVTDNLVLKIGLVLLADGVARFLGRPSFIKIGIVFLALHILFWTLAVVYVPADLALRIHLSTAFTVVMMGLLARSVYLSHTQSRFLRWITIGLLAEYAGASLLQSLFVYWVPATVENGPILSNVNAWYFFQGTLFITALFICLLCMVSMRLFADLQDRNTALANEVAERRRLEVELSASLDAERAAREEQNLLMHMVSHEFRTPLAAIRYARDMIEAVLERPPQTVAKRLVGIDQSIERMTMLIDRFLAGQKQEEGILESEELDIAKLMESVTQPFILTGQEGQLRLSNVEQVRGYWGDPEMLGTVLINLIDNALKYSFDDSPVEIAVFERKNILVFQVSDRGIGVPEADRGHLGRRYFRASNARGRTGTGLGLHACRKLLGYHNGTLSLSPRPGGGTVAIARLPFPGLRPGEMAGRQVEEQV